MGEGKGDGGRTLGGTFFLAGAVVVVGNGEIVVVVSERRWRFGMWLMRISWRGVFRRGWVEDV